VEYWSAECHILAHAGDPCANLEPLPLRWIRLRRLIHGCGAGGNLRVLFAKEL
jgi:hypothetical protein